MKNYTRHPFGELAPAKSALALRLPTFDRSTSEVDGIAVANRSIAGGKLVDEIEAIEKPAIVDSAVLFGLAAVGEFPEGVYAADLTSRDPQTGEPCKLFRLLPPDYARRGESRLDCPKVVGSGYESEPSMSREYAVVFPIEGRTFGGHRMPKILWLGDRSEEMAAIYTQSLEEGFRNREDMAERRKDNFPPQEFLARWIASAMYFRNGGGEIWIANAAEHYNPESDRRPPIHQPHWGPRLGLLAYN